MLRLKRSVALLGALFGALVAVLLALSLYSETATAQDTPRPIVLPPGMTASVSVENQDEDKFETPLVATGVVYRGKKMPGGDCDWKSVYTRVRGNDSSGSVSSSITVSHKSDCTIVVLDVVWHTTP